MKLIKYIKRFFRKHKRPANPFSDAISQGIQEAFKDMGYDVKRSE